MTTPLQLTATDADLVRPFAPSTRSRRPIREVATFLIPVYLVVLALSWAMPGEVGDPSPAALLTMLTPAFVVGVLALGARRRHAAANPHRFGLRRLGVRSWPVAVLVPLVGIGLPFAIVRALGIVSFSDLGLYALDAPINLVIVTFLALGEEIGWRGYVLLRLREVMPVRRAALATGLLQGLFHLPLVLLTPTYTPFGPRWVVAPVTVLVLTTAGPLFGWLRIRSGSLWPVAIAHAAVNTCLLEAPVLVSDRSDLAASLAGEGGILTLLLVATSAVLITKYADWTPRRQEDGEPVAA